MIRKQNVRNEKIPRDANLRDAKVPWPFRDTCFQTNAQGKIDEW